MASRPKTPGSGRKKKTKNKATVEREAQARLAIEADVRRRDQESAARLKAAGVATVEDAKAIARAEPKLMKEIAFDFAELFAGMAAFYQPFPSWTVDPRTNKVVNGNPNYDEAKFKEYAVLATQTALGAAAYQSPKLSAVMVKAEVVNEIEITGGLPDDEDGGLQDAEQDPVRDAARLAGAKPDQGPGGAADVPPEAGGAVPAEGEAEGGPVRKAVG